MFKNYLKIAYRNLIKNKVFSIIDILGLGFGMSICLAIAAYLVHEYSFNRCYANSNRIFRLIDSPYKSSTIDYRVKDILLDNYPEIENACLFLLVPVPTPVTIHNRGAYIDNLTSADNAFFEIFNVPVISGDPANPLPDLNSVVLTVSAAKRLFGDENPMGREIELQHRFPLKVTGIIQDFPDNSNIQPQMIVNAENDDFKFTFSCENGNDKSTYRWLFSIYLSLNHQADKKDLIEKINSHPELLRPYEEQIGLLSIEDMYLHDETYGSGLKAGNSALLRLLLAIGLTILVLAVINYINLTSAQQYRRYTEIGVKKSIGAGKKDIFLQFLIESVLISLLSFVIAIAFFVESLPIYRSLFYEGFNINHLLAYWAVIVSSVIVLGILSGLGNAILFSSLHPIPALKGEILTRRGGIFWRNGLTVFQFMVSISLIFCIIVIQKQIGYVKHRNPGFNEEQLLKLDVPQIQLKDKTEALLLIDQFRQFPGIKNITMTNGVPGFINTHMGSGIAGKKKSLPIIYADCSFPETFGMKLLSGRTPVPGDFGTACLINESAYQFFEWTDLENKRYDNGRPGGFRVVGVVSDFHFNSLRSAIEPMCILFANDVYPSHLSIRIAPGQTGPVMQFIEKTWRKILPQYPLQYEFYDSWLDAMYREDERMGTAIGLFCHAGYCDLLPGYSGDGYFFITETDQGSRYPKSSCCHGPEYPDFINETFHQMGASGQYFCMASRLVCHEPLAAEFCLSYRCSMVDVYAGRRTGHDHGFFNRERSDHSHGCCKSCGSAQV